MGMGSSKVDKSKASEILHSFKPPIHRIAPNTIAKNDPVKKELFKVVLPTAAARMRPNLIGDFKKYARRDLWPSGRIHTILPDGESKLVIMNPHVDPKDINTLSESAREYLKDHEDIKLQPHTVELDWDFWTADDILEATLPPEAGEITSGYSLAGHIAHMNLRDRHLPYRYHIGSVILSKSAQQGVKTVVNKLENICSQYRVFDMEVIAGEENFQVTQFHLGCTFSFDFSKVYWNTRLDTEHRRLVDMFEPGEVICDVFAGVGPFAVPAGKKGCFVLANDLNPDSYESLKANAKTNKVAEFVRSYNEDGRKFIRESLRLLREWRQSERQVKIPQKKRRHDGRPLPPKIVCIPRDIDHFVMNLPGSATEFLDEFRGLYNGKELQFSPYGNSALPLIHVYSFQSNLNAKEGLLKDVRVALGFDIEESALSIHTVRNVSPHKDMYCCSFRLPPQVAFAERTSEPRKEVL